MTGGAGLVRDGLNSLYRDRALQRKHNEKADIPTVSVDPVTTIDESRRIRVSEYEEYLRKKIELARRRSKIRLTISVAAMFSVLLLILYFLGR